MHAYNTGIQKKEQKEAMNLFAKELIEYKNGNDSLVGAVGGST